MSAARRVTTPPERLAEVVTSSMRTVSSRTLVGPSYRYEPCPRTRAQAFAIRRRVSRAEDFLYGASRRETSPFRQLRSDLPGLEKLEASSNSSSDV